MFATKSICRSLLLFLCLSGAVLAQPAPRQSTEPVPVDRIVAVVNNEVITLQELRARLSLAVSQLRQQGTPMPPRDVLERQMLERLVTDKLQIQRAREMGLRIDDTQLSNALQRIADNNKLTLAQLREALARDGIEFEKFREDVRNEMTIARVREREVENRIVVSEGEIDSYLSGESNKEAAAEQYEVAHILLRAPEAASPEQIQGLKAKAEGILERAQKGENFAQLAAAYSDAPDGLRGGNLGMRPLERLPAIFAEAIARVKPGEIVPLLRSSNGFHIVKLLGKQGGASLPPVQQTHARHILIKVNELVSENDAKHKMDVLYDRIRHGEDFAELARLYSQDGSATKGGDLGWVYPGDTVPEFERAMDQLKPGELARPVRSPFGYHLIQVLERRVQEASDERQRSAIRQILRERKLDESYQDWLRQLRDSAYVEIRIEEP